LVERGLLGRRERLALLARELRPVLGVNPGLLQGFHHDVLPVFAAQEVPAAHIVHVAVAVIVEAIARHLGPLAPQHGFQVRVGRVDARIEHGHQHRRGRALGQQLPVRPVGADARHAVGLQVEVLPAAHGVLLSAGGEGGQGQQAEQGQARKGWQGRSTHQMG